MSELALVGKLQRDRVPAIRALAALIPNELPEDVRSGVHQAMYDARYACRSIGMSWLIAPLIAMILTACASHDKDMYEERDRIEARFARGLRCLKRARRSMHSDSSMPSTRVGGS